MRLLFKDRRVALIVTSLFILSCDKEQVSFLSYDVFSQIEGSYEVKSIVWDGNPIDLNNDNKASNDLYGELMSLPYNEMAKDEQGAVVFGNVVREKVSGSICLSLPIQGIHVMHDGRYDGMIGNTLYQFLPFTIDSGGVLSIEHLDSVRSSEYESRLEMKSIHDGTVSFDQMGNMYFTVCNVLYDYREQKLVEGVIQYKFAKIHD